MWDTTSGKPVGVSRRVGPVGATALSHAGDLVAVHEFDHQHVVVWEVETGRVRMTTTHLTDLVHTFFSPDGRRCFLNYGYPSNTLHMWDVDSGKGPQLLSGHTNTV